jgi:glutamine synthetase
MPIRSDILMSHTIETEKIIDLLYEDLSEYIPEINIGCELEFYLRNIHNPQEAVPKIVRDKIFKAIEDDFDLIDIIKEENGFDQYEVVYKPTYKLKHLCESINDTKYYLHQFFIKNDIRCIFSAKPIYDMESSAMQMNITLHGHDGNILAKDNKIFQNAVGGLIKYIQASMIIFCPTSFCFNRIKSFDDIKKFRNSPSFVALSSSDNRTGAIRLAKASCFNVIGDDKNVRIEHRTPSSLASSYYCIIFILLAILLGIEDEESMPNEIFGNVFDDDILFENNLSHLPSCIAEAYYMFDEEMKFREYLTKYINMSQEKE